MQLVSVLLTVVFFGCAKPSAPLETSGVGIANGSRLDTESLPGRSTIVLYISNKAGTKEIGACTASLISPDLAVTAAHCLWDPAINPNPKNAFVYFGERTRGIAVEPSKIRRVQSFRFHPKYRPAKDKVPLLHDIAIIRFTGVAPLPFVPAQLLAKSRVLKPLEPVYVAGYGLQTESGFDPGEILHGYSKYRIRLLKDPQTRMVEIKGRRKRGLLPGDSGGPAFIIERGQPKLWGVYSAGIFEDGEAYFEDLRLHSRWIEASARAMGSDFRYPL